MNSTPFVVVCRRRSGDRDERGCEGVADAVREYCILKSSEVSSDMGGIVGCEYFIMEYARFARIHDPLARDSELPGDIR
jgi:hypothetical protein